MLTMGTRLSEAFAHLITPGFLAAGISTVLTVIIVLILSWLVLRLLNSSLLTAVFRGERHYLSDRRTQTLALLLRSMVRYLVYFLATITILSKLGVPVASLLAAAGVGGVALGFGAQSLVRDVITGFFLLFENQFAVGDHVTLAGVSGIVEEMALRVTRLRDFGGQLHIIPNGQIQQVTNHNGSKMRVLVEVTLPLETCMDRVETILSGVFIDFGAERAAVREGPMLLGLTRMDHTGRTIQILARTEPGQQWAIERELRAAIWKALLDAGITPARPLQEIQVTGFGERGAGDADEDQRG